MKLPRRNIFRILTLAILLALLATMTASAAPGDTTRVSLDSSGTQGNNDSSYPSISADGRYVTFQSNATNLVSGDTNGIWDVFVHDLQSARWEGVTVWQVLVDAGVQMTENAGCAACLGGPLDTFGRMNAPLKCISATNRNFPGRMGHKESQIFLASPATVAASASMFDQVPSSLRSLARRKTASA